MFYNHQSSSTRIRRSEVGVAGSPATFEFSMHGLRGFDAGGKDNKASALGKPRVVAAVVRAWRPEELEGAIRRVQKPDNNLCKLRSESAHINAMYGC